ncbi:unnamed protein product [Linum tenue]|uniref:peptidyl-tRNA hydrolase n=1 Tax=Linum tenue TaxID=586396 RepID=A0AAV0K6M7_9ROSI|nr:unnamed protein product [Linum tenue]
MGRVVTQGCQVVVAAIRSHRNDAHTVRYWGPEKIDSMHKVTLEVEGETQMLNLAEKLKGGGIVHKLWIEQPVPPSIFLPSLTLNLKLLRFQEAKALQVK